MPSPRLAALEILAAANNAPQQLEIERQKAARSAQTAQLVGGAVQSLIPQLAGAGGQLYGMAAKDAADAGNADALAHSGDFGASTVPPSAPAAGGDDLDALAKVRAGVTTPAAPGGYAQGPGAYAQKLADDNPDLKPGTGFLDQLLGNGLKDKRREAFMAAAVPQIAKQRADAQAASEHAVDRANTLDEGNIKRTTERTNAAKDVLGATALPSSTLDLGYSDLQRLTADPSAPDLNAGIKSRDQQFYEANKSALDSLGIGSTFGQNLAGGNLASRDATAAKEAEAEKEAARQRDTQSAAQREQERANRAREGLGYAELNQHAKDASANRQAELDRAKVIASRQSDARDEKPQPEVLKIIKPLQEMNATADHLLSVDPKVVEAALGLGQTTWGKVKSTFKADDPQVTAFRSDIADLVGVRKHELTGAAASDKETKALLEDIANGGDSVQGFNAKVHALKTRLSYLHDAGVRSLAQAGYPVGHVQPLDAPAPGPQLSAKQQVVDSILHDNPDATPDQIRAALAAKGL